MGGLMSISTTYLFENRYFFDESLQTSWNRSVICSGKISGWNLRSEMSRSIWNWSISCLLSWMPLTTPSLLIPK